ncbi:phosphotransferase/anion transporter [Lucifera butyrica]|uniref:Phosphotransferase/anion transporter n=1 Tax=Lucifera butyrica TaxID=1351585 RepID=A0A498RHL5_9FIRM|nr:PTS sugar transporter subunit IIA [Lucifera butyrica]VBB09603.1 phosphotransferase/anion transporter [Lucifera butyrica]
MSELFAKEHIKLNLDLKDKDAYLRYIAQLALELGIGKEAQGVYEGLVKRENEFATNLGGGIAIPHTKSEHILKPAVLVLKPRREVAWGDGGEEGVRVIIGILSRNEQGGNAHLELLASLARKLIDGVFKKILVTSGSEEEIFFLVEQALYS